MSDTRTLNMQSINI